MRIAQVSLQYGPTVTGGGGVHVEKVVEYLRQEGHQVSVLSIHTTETLASGPGLCADGRWSRETSDGLTVVRFLIDEDIEHPYAGDKHAELNRIHRFSQAVAGWLRQRSAAFDLVHLHGHHAVPGWLARALRDLPFRVISTIHYLESTNVKATGGALIHYRISDEDLARMKEWETMARHADVPIIISPGQREDFLDLLSERGIDRGEVEGRLRLVSSGIDPTSVRGRKEVEAKLAARPNPVKVLTFARLDPVKGVEYAIRGAALAAEMTDLPFELTVAGVPEEEVYIPVLERDIDLARKVLPVRFLLLDHIFSPPERDAFLDQFDVYLFPTLREPFGITVVEAAARGLAVVTTDSPGPSYLLRTDDFEERDWGQVTRYGLLVRRTGHPEQSLAANLAQGLVSTLEDWQAAAERALAFHRCISGRFTWPRVVEEYLTLYQCDEL